MMLRLLARIERFLEADASGEEYAVMFEDLWRSVEGRVRLMRIEAESIPTYAINMFEAYEVNIEAAATCLNLGIRRYREKVSRKIVTVTLTPDADTLRKRMDLAVQLILSIREGYLIRDEIGSLTKRKLPGANGEAEWARVFGDRIKKLRKELGVCDHGTALLSEMLQVANNTA